MKGDAQEPYEYDDEAARFCAKCDAPMWGSIDRQGADAFAYRWLADLDLLCVTCVRCGYAWHMKPADTLAPYIPPEPPIPGPLKRKWWRRA